MSVLIILHIYCLAAIQPFDLSDHDALIILNNSSPHYHIEKSWIHEFFVTIYVYLREIIAESDFN